MKFREHCLHLCDGSLDARKRIQETLLFFYNFFACHFKYQNSLLRFTHGQETLNRSVKLMGKEMNA